MRKIILFFGLYFIWGISISQAQFTRQLPAAISVFSDKEPFILFLDNVAYNQKASTAVKVEGVNKRSVTLRLEWSRNGRRVSTESVVDLYSENGYFLDIAYTISKSGPAKLVLHSLFPVGDFVQPNFDQLGTYVYGRPNQVIFKNEQPTFAYPSYSDVEFADFIKSLKKQSFDKDKLKFIKVISPDIFLSVKQIETVMKQFSFDEGKLNAAKVFYANCIDRQNYHKLVSAFSFNSSGNNLLDFIAASRNI